MAEISEILTTEENNHQVSNIEGFFVLTVGEEKAPELSTIQRWAAKLRVGLTSVSDAARNGRLNTSSHKEMVNEVKRLIADDRRSR